MSPDETYALDEKSNLTIASFGYVHRPIFYLQRKLVLVC